MKPKLLLIGGGGHCASCIDVIEQHNHFEIAGIVERNLSINSVLGYPILGCDDDLEALILKYRYALVTVGQLGNGEKRIKLFQHLKHLGFQLATVISPRAYVSKHASVGEGTIIMHDALINARATIGDNCIINTKALIEHDAFVMDSCHISTGSIVNGRASIGRGSFVGSNAISKENVRSNDFEFIKAGSIFKGQQ